MNLEEYIMENGSGNGDILYLQAKYEKEIANLKAKNKKLIGIIGHDMKTPVSTIISFLTLIQDHLSTSNLIKIESHVLIALNAAKKTAHMLDDLLEWAITDNVLSESKPENLSLRILFAEELENIAFISSEKELSFLSDIPEDAVVFADRIMIKIVIRNLLSNAIKYSFPSGEIKIYTKQIKDHIEISIRDQGVGISKENQVRLFSADGYNTTPGTNSESGTGFGLMLCKDLIMMNKGKILIISEPGEGSEIKFTLPSVQKMNS